MREGEGRKGRAGETGRAEEGGRASAGREDKGREGEREAERLDTKFHVNVCIVSASGGQTAQFWSNLDIWGLLYQTPSYRRGSNCCAKAEPRSTLTRQISSECVHCVKF